MVPHPSAGRPLTGTKIQTRALEQQWKGPYVVILTTPTAVNVGGIAGGSTKIHVSHLKPAHMSSEQDDWRVEKINNPLELLLRRQNK